MSFFFQILKPSQVIQLFNIFLFVYFHILAKVIYIRLAIMISLLVDTFLSIQPKLWFPTLESAANLKWWEILNGRKRQSKRIGTKGEDRPGIEPRPPSERPMSYPLDHEELLEEYALLSGFKLYFCLETRAKLETLSSK